MLAHGFAFTQAVSTGADSVMVTTQIWHKSGEWIASMLELKSRDGFAANVGAATTYARRFGFSAMVGIASEDDDDGASQVPPKRDSKPNQAPPPKKPPANVPRETKPAEPPVIFDVKNNAHIDRMEAWLKNSSVPIDRYDDFMLAMNGKPIDQINRVAMQFQVAEKMRDE